MGVQGSVSDFGGAGTPVEFMAYANTTLVDDQTRAAVLEVKSYNFTLDGSAWPGGITKEYICLWDLHDGSPIEYEVHSRP